MSDTDWMLTLSGPLARRAPLLASLARAGVDVEQDHGPHGLPAEDASVGWLHVRHHDVDAVAAEAQRAGWALRAHWPTPKCGVCGGIGKANGPAGLGDCLHCAGTGRTPKRAPTAEERLQAEIAELHERIARLENREG